MRHGVNVFLDVRACIYVELSESENFTGDTANYNTSPGNVVGGN